MLSWKDILARQEHYNDLLGEAEKERLVRQALAGRARRVRLYCRALTWLGLRLVAWGCYLQKRYGAAVEAPALRAEITPGEPLSTCYRSL
jgi:hypothetical protein